MLRCFAAKITEAARSRHRRSRCSVEEAVHKQTLPISEENTCIGVSF